MIFYVVQLQSITWKESFITDEASIFPLFFIVCEIFVRFLFVMALHMPCQVLGPLKSSPADITFEHSRLL
jgi:hypothetical protein